MADRVLNVRVTGDTSGLGRSFNKASKESQNFGQHVHKHVVGVFHEIAKAAEFAGAAIGITFGTALLEGVKIAADNQVAVTKLRVAVEKSHWSWHTWGKEIQETQDRLAGLSGFTNTDLETSLATLVSTTGNVTRAQHLQVKAMDLARARSIPLAQATTIMSKVWNGNTTSLTRLGISLGKHATREQALAALQKKFGGSYEAYANTASGALARIRASVDILLERVGKVLLPYLNQFAAWFAEHLPEIQEKAGKVFGFLGDQIRNLISVGQSLIGFYQRWSVWVQAAAAFIGTLVIAIESYILVTKAIRIATELWTAAQAALNIALDANPIGIAVIAAAALAAMFVVLWKRSGTFRTIVKGALHDVQIAFNFLTGFIHDHWGAVAGFIEHRFNTVKTIVVGFFGFIRDHWKIILGVMTGGVGIAAIFIINHFDTIKKVFNHVVHFMVARWGDVRSVISKFAGWVNQYIIGPIKAIIRWVQKAIGWLSKLNPFGGSPSTGGGAGGQQAQAYAASKMAAHGWSTSQMPALTALWNQESGWNRFAYNASSGATGIPQALPYTKMPRAAWLPSQGGSASMPAQVDWGLGYIGGRYGTPNAAWAHEQSVGWYDRGGVVPGPRGKHSLQWVAGGETILPTHKGGGYGIHIHYHAPVIGEREVNATVQKALRANARAGNASFVGGLVQR